MNKRGGMYSLVLLLVLLSIGTVVYQYESINNQKFPVENITNRINISEVNITMPETPRLQNSLNYYLNGFLNAYEELMKWAFEWAAENPQVPYKLLLFLGVIAILSPVILLLVKLIIIFYLLIREYILNKREKKELRRLNDM